MFDRIFDFIAAVWEWFIPFVVVDTYEEGVVLRFGLFNRKLQGGWHLVWPFGIEEVKAETVVRQTSYLDVQSLTTRDKRDISIAGIIVYEIVDIRKFLLDIDDGEEDMQNMVYGIISDKVEQTRWDDIRDTIFNKGVFDSCKTECLEYCGVRIRAIKWSDKAKSRNIRLWND